MNTPRLDLPLLAAAQAQKHVTINEALLALDGLTHLHLEAITASPPPAPAEGSFLAVAAGATGAFAGREGKVAERRDMAWLFHVPRAGWTATVGSAVDPHVFDGSAWRRVLPLDLHDLATLGIGAAANAANPLTARLNNALFNARPAADGGSGDIRLKLNRESDAKAASLVFQTGFSGRAELGLTSGGGLSARVSPDGNVFTTALTVDPATAIASLPTRPAFCAQRVGTDMTFTTVGARLMFNAAPVNVGNRFDVAASQFVAPVAGTYAFAFQVFASLANTRTIVDLVRSGSGALILRGERANVGGSFQHIGANTVTTLAANERVELVHTMGSSTLLVGAFTQFSGHLVG